MGAYTDAQRQSGQRAMIAEGVFSRAMEGLTGGVVLAGFALALGATDFQIGLIAAIPFLSQLVNVPGVALLNRFPDRKPFVVALTIAGRSLFFLIALLPLLTDVVSPVGALIGLLSLYAVVSTLSGAGWQVWLRSLVPRESLGSYFGRRMRILSAVGLVVLLLAAAFVARFGGNVAAYGILFALGGALGLASSGILAGAPSMRMPHSAARSYREALQAPFRDREYRGVLVFLGAWGFAANLALPFVSVVLLRSLGYDLVTVALLSAMSQLANIGGLALWAPLTDRHGNKPVLGLSAVVFIAAMTMWALVPKAPGMAVLGVAAVAHVLLGFALAGLDVASNNVTMKLAPEEDAASYLASASVVKAIAAGVAPLLGGLAVTLLGGREFRLQVAWEDPGAAGGVLTALRLGPYDLLFVASVAIGLYAVHRLLGFKEAGEAPPEAVVRAMRRDVAQISSVAGMRTFAHVASYLVEATYRVERAVVPAGLVDEEDEQDRARRRRGDPGAR